VNIYRKTKCVVQSIMAALSTTWRRTVCTNLDT